MPPNPLSLVASLPRMAATLPKMAPDLSQVPAGRLVTLADGVTTRLYDTGEEYLQPVVLLHGMAATGMLNWYQTFERLRGEFRLITYDQRWHGYGYKGEFSFERLTDDVFRVLDHLRLEQPVLGGYSMGGLVTQLAARRDASRLGGMVLAATGTGAQRNALEKVTMNGFVRTSPLLNAVPEELVEGEFSPIVSPHRWALKELSSVSMATHRTVIAQVARFNSTTWLPELDLPAAVVKTLHDVAFPQRVQDEMAELLPRSAVFPIDAGHAVCATQPGTFARRMRTAVNWVQTSPR